MREGDIVGQRALPGGGRECGREFEQPETERDPNGIKLSGLLDKWP